MGKDMSEPTECDNPSNQVCTVYHSVQQFSDISIGSKMDLLEFFDTNGKEYQY